MPRRVLALSLLVLFCPAALSFSVPQKRVESAKSDFVPANNPSIQYIGRIDFTNPKRPRFWASGVCIMARFKGSYCDILVNDEQLYGNNHNYIEIVIDDGKPFRVQTTGVANSIRAAAGLVGGEHTILICKDTESGNGYLEFLGFKCAGLLPLPVQTGPIRRLEFVGDSITCGMSADLSIPCGKGQWFDQHNAYLAYGPVTARSLGTEWSLTSVSGIGLIHSCCGMTITMPEVFDKLNPRANAFPWDFSRYQPDAVTICLGQNDGVQDSAKFCDAYVRFIEQVRAHYPQAEIVCLTSPMADAALTAFLKASLTSVVERMNKSGDAKVHSFFFSKRYHNGCWDHPDVAEHQQIANELEPYLKQLLGW
ncbi:MAG TPA: SGNH/GDSL hydrolase family protein [Blastocatellia bacterium]|nr:SGNH/GDSL hydrolase family protein [Blastocatellia bacterium]